MFMYCGRLSTSNFAFIIIPKVCSCSLFKCFLHPSFLISYLRKTLSVFHALRSSCVLSLSFPHPNSMYTSCGVMFMYCGRLSTSKFVFNIIPKVLFCHASFLIPYLRLLVFTDFYLNTVSMIIFLVICQANLLKLVH